MKIRDPSQLPSFWLPASSEELGAMRHGNRVGVVKHEQRQGLDGGY